MALALNNLKRVDMPLNKETKIKVNLVLYRVVYHFIRIFLIFLPHPNPLIKTRRVSDEPSISKSCMDDHLHDRGKSTEAVELCILLPKYCKTFDSPLYIKNSLATSILYQGPLEIYLI